MEMKYSSDFTSVFSSELSNLSFARQSKWHFLNRTTTFATAKNVNISFKMTIQMIIGCCDASGSFFHVVKPYVIEFILR